MTSRPPRSRTVVVGARLALALAVIVSQPLDASAQKRGGSAVLPGGNGKQPINIEAVKLDYFDKEQKLIYTGNVVATQGDAKLKASTLTIFLAPKKPSADTAGDAPASGTSQVQRMLAVGPVTLIQRNQVGTGDNGLYDKAANTVVLTGNVTLSQGPNVTKGDKLTYDLKSGQAVVTGRVKSLFQPEDRATTSPGDEENRPSAAKKSAASGSRGL